MAEWPDHNCVLPAKLGWSVLAALSRAWIKLAPRPKRHVTGFPLRPVPEIPDLCGSYTPTRRLFPEDIEARHTFPEGRAYRDRGTQRFGQGETSQRRQAYPGNMNGC